MASLYVVMLDIFKLTWCLILHNTTGTIFSTSPHKTTTKNIFFRTLKNLMLIRSSNVANHIKKFVIQIPSVSLNRLLLCCSANVATSCRSTTSRSRWPYRRKTTPRPFNTWERRQPLSSSLLICSTSQDRLVNYRNYPCFNEWPVQ